MSCFDGKVIEYGGRIVVDHFSSPTVRRGQLFFLTHCHKDHMSGLGCTHLTATLRSGAARGLFCSSVTRDLLRADPGFAHLRSFLIPLPYEEPTTLSFPDSDSYTTEDDRVTVTLLPAGHCPGSAMFLFEGKQGTVLCTGDLRLGIGGAGALSGLHGVDGRVKTVKTMYLDTTFCHPMTKVIPTRERSLEIVIEQVRKWLARSHRHYVCIKARMFGYEYMWTALAQQFSMPVHVAEAAYKCCSAALPDVVQHLTTDPTLTRIHSCRWESMEKSYRSSLPCGFMPGEGRPPVVLWIKLSTMAFARGQGIPKCGFIEVSEQFCHVVHSMHSSLEELRDFVAYVKPQRVQPTVIPAGRGSKLEDALTHLQDVLCSKDSVSGDTGCIRVETDSKLLEEGTGCLKRLASWPAFRSTIPDRNENTSPSKCLSPSVKENLPVSNTASLLNRSKSLSSLSTKRAMNDISEASLSLLDDETDDLTVPATPPKRRRLF